MFCQSDLKRINRSGNRVVQGNKCYNQHSNISVPEKNKPNLVRSLLWLCVSMTHDAYTVTWYTYFLTTHPVLILNNVHFLKKLHGASLSVTNVAFKYFPKSIPDMIYIHIYKTILHKSWNSSVKLILMNDQEGQVISLCI